MKTVYKYLIGCNDKTVLKVPQGGKILCCKTQAKIARLWILVNTKCPVVIRTFYLYGTGYPINEDLNLEYVDTFLIRDDSFVFHLFEEV